MNEIIPIDELINNKIVENRYMIDNLLLVNTSIIFAAVEKVGKTTLALQLLIAVANQEKFLDLKEVNYHIDTIILFSNDSTPESIRIKLSKMSFENVNRFEIYTLFQSSISAEELFAFIDKINLCQKKVLLIVDVLSGIRVSNNYNMNDYVSMTDVIDQIEKNMKKRTKTFGIIYLHHLNKANGIMGSRAIGSRVSAIITLTVDSSHDYGVLDIVGNDIECRKIYIKKDKKNHKWLLDRKANQLSDNDLDYQLLRINEALMIAKNNKIVGDVNKIVATTRVNILPRNLTRWLKANKRYLNDNNIYFEKRKSGTTIVELYLKVKK